ncbi:MAG: leucine--tRNA ligase [Candidatus Diapherotrites archaeon]|nr:leucine--tRNA ligase [Candidatus Diapherotrites archaeon]
MRYDFSAAEKKWPEKWEGLGASMQADADAKSASPPRDKKFFMHFAYPGISGYQHVGHMRGFSYTDIICRYKRMTGHSVFFPIGTHATGNQALGFASKVKKKDKTWLDYLEANGYPMNEIKKMESVDTVVDYFNKNYQENWRLFGFLADFNSFTCTTYPEYQKFIQWQFRKLNGLGLLVQKPYYATFCPNCGPVAVDPSETDISRGGTAEKHEYTLLKFKLGSDYIVAATLRPETVFGQTNLWADPCQEYVKVKVGNETWICSPQCAEKLSFQKEGVKTIAKTSGSELIGLKALAPGVDREIPILPSKFVDPNVGTGLVTSVPSDAPYDWMALHDLQKEGKHKDIKVIPIIKSRGWGDTAALRICGQMKIKDQNDPRLEDATKEIYKSGFHTGVMNENCGEYAGMPVERAKDQVKEWLISENKADIMYDLSEEVVCRCGGHVVVKLIPDAWFINYADEELTLKSKGHAEGMDIMPGQYKENIEGVLDWFQERACARLGNWLGTPLPFDEKWTIEPISDSTLYPAFYVVSRFVNNGELKTEDLTEEFFDYVFLAKGKGRPAWDKVRKEFDYWYPVDINLGGKEHQTVHFPVYIMNHVAILPADKWPRGIFVNYWIVGKGGKISKSKGGASASPQEAAKRFSVDGLRLYYAHVGSPHTDIEWDEDTAFSYKSHIEGIYSLVHRFKGFDKASSPMDAWLVSRFNTRLKQYTKAMEKYDLRTAVGSMLFDFQRELAWYEKRGGNSKAAKAIVMDWLKCLTPFIPFVAEECWEMLGCKGLVSTQEIPAADETKIDARAELAEEITRSVEQDILHVIRLAKIQPKKITLFVAPAWKRTAWEKARSLGRKTLMPELMKLPELKSKEGAAFAGFLQKKFHELRDIPGEAEEKEALETAAGYLSGKFNSKVEVVLASASKPPKSKNAVPGKPAILVE